jgi:hypothetical protein
MSQVFPWLGGILSAIYGTLTAFAGYGQSKVGKMPMWEVWSFSFSGLIVLAAGILTLLQVGSALWILVVGLFCVHVLAINNGLKMFGKINASHHLVRFIVSVVLIVLTYLGMN